MSKTQEGSYLDSNPMLMEILPGSIPLHRFKVLTTKIRHVSFDQIIDLNYVAMKKKECNVWSIIIFKASFYSPQEK